MGKSFLYSAPVPKTNTINTTARKGPNSGDTRLPSIAGKALKKRSYVEVLTLFGKREWKKPAM